MNTPGENDGVLQSWFDGELALDRADIRYRDVDTLALDTVYFSTFFGGSGEAWAPTADEVADVDDLIVSTGPVSFLPETGAVDCAALNPGSFPTDWSFVVYRPSSKETEFSRID